MLRSLDSDKDNKAEDHDRQLTNAAITFEIRIALSGGIVLKMVKSTQIARLDGKKQMGRSWRK
jgi:hypothetical protein